MRERKSRKNKWYNIIHSSKQILFIAYNNYSYIHDKKVGIQQVRVLPPTQHHELLQEGSGDQSLEIPS